MYCRSNNVKFYMDGARLSGGFRLARRGASLCVRDLQTLRLRLRKHAFYKVLGGLAGSMLLGETSFCASARVWLRRFGGNLFTLAPFASSSADVDVFWVSLSFFGAGFRPSRQVGCVSRCSFRRRLTACVSPGAPDCAPPAYARVRDGSNTELAHLAGSLHGVRTTPGNPV